MPPSNIALAGAACFGIVVGWITYRTLRRREGAALLSDIATVIGALGGAAIITLFDDPELFGWYAIGLVIGFFAYFVIGLLVTDKDSSSQWMGD
jgi:O-antigen/teichoic acid export membrane protein